MNPVRMRFIRDKLVETAQDERVEGVPKAFNPLKGLDVLDVGCGGGLLSEVSLNTHLLQAYLPKLWECIESCSNGCTHSCYRCLKSQY